MYSSFPLPLGLNGPLRPVHTDCGNNNDNGNGRMGYIGPYGSVHMETCGKGKGNPSGPIQSILSIVVAAVSVNEPLLFKISNYFCAEMVI